MQTSFLNLKIADLPHATLVIGASPAEAELWAKDLGVSPFDTVTLQAAEEGGIKEVRGFGSQLQLSPQFGEVRLGLIFDADQLTPQAQNALLKLLEEPPAQVKMILFTATQAAILPTVISRCRRYHAAATESTRDLPTFKRDALAQFLAAESLAKDDQLVAIAKQWLETEYTNWCATGRSQKGVDQLNRFWDVYQKVQSPSANKRLLLEQLVVLSL
jgi:hypothetical protein